jgi:hypothetical protein
VDRQPLTRTTKYRLLLSDIKKEEKKKKKKEEEAAKEKAKKQKARMVSKKKKMVEEVGKEVVMPEVEVKQQGIEAMALIEVVISSVEATTHMGSVSLTFLFLYPNPYTLVCLFTCNFLF